ncbi:MAG: efflux RND transporter periplasmic adaptor subunit [Alphaproteobacteria bacterium]|nr:efflux RND transporter periplasmic adaptor subunit [Alphaproteobacteria bacterium]
MKKVFFGQLKKILDLLLKLVESIPVPKFLDPFFRELKTKWKNFRYKTYAYVAAAILLLVLIILIKLLGNKSQINEFTPPTVTASKAVFGPVTKYVNAIGTLRPFDSVVIRSEVNSNIKEIHFTEGSVVNEGDLLVELDDDAATAALMEAEAQYRKAKSEYDPTEKLAGKGILARVQRDMKKAEMDMCEARVKSCKTTLEKHKIHAPFGGVVGLKEISKGQFVSAGSELLKLVDCHPLKVDFKVAEVDIGNIYVDQEIKILVGGDKTQEYTAKITAIDPESDKVTHTFNVRAILDVPKEVALSSQALKPGRFVSVKAEIDGNQQGILVPESSLEKIGEEDMLYRIVDGLAIRTLVTTGVRRDGNVEIITGVNENDSVITSGQTNVLDGKPVSIQSGRPVAEIAEALKEFYKKEAAAKKKAVSNKK